MNNTELTLDQLSDVSAGAARDWCGTCSGRRWIIIYLPSKKNPPETQNSPEVSEKY